MKSKTFATLVCFCAITLSNANGRCDDPLVKSPIAATVNDESILVSEVDRELRVALGTRKLDPAAERYFRATTLEQLIDRQLILQWLRATEQGASQAEIDLEISRTTKRLQARGVAFAEHLASRQITEPEMRRLLQWKIGWRKFLARYLTDDNLEKYFNEHRRDFDGTRIRVAHILFVVNRDDPADEERILRRAAEVRESILSGTITFADAAQQHSSAPTSSHGGEIGFIERHKPMHESFSRAAFALGKDETSPPIVSPFGVHLIRCQAIEPGQRTWQDAREELKLAVTRYLFEWAADKERAKTEIAIKDISSP